MSATDPGRDGAAGGVALTVPSVDRSVPPVFRDVVCQPHAVESMAAAARHPVHAYLFHGPASGTRVAARAFAAALLCDRGGCGACSHCRRVRSGAHPDLAVVERTGASLSLEDVRRAVGLAQRRPLEADRQVLVVVDVHLAARSAPALLKTIEEPPSTTVFVLLAEDVPPELSTVASRCVEVVFPPVPTTAVVAWLEERGVEHERAVVIAAGSGGDLDRAGLLAEDPGYAERVELWRSVPARLDGNGVVAGELARTLLAGVDEALGPLRASHEAELEALAEQARSLGERTVPGRREVVERQHREERRWRTDELRQGLGVLARAYRDRLVDAVQPAAARDPVAEQGLEAAVSEISATAASLRRNPNEVLLLESLLVHLGDAGR